MSWRTSTWPDIEEWAERFPAGDEVGTPVIPQHLAAWAIVAEMRPNPFAGTNYELDEQTEQR